MSRVKFGSPETVPQASDDNYADTAARIVNDAIHDAITQLEKHFMEEFGFSLDNSAAKEQFGDSPIETQKGKEEEFDRTKTPLLIDASQPGPEIPNIKWMTIDEMTEELAANKIDEFIKKVNEIAWELCNVVSQFLMRQG